MKKIYSAFAFIISVFISSAANFTPGNLVVVRMGDGSAVLSSVATAVFLDEYTPAGVLVQSIALPTTTSGANFALTNAGSSTSEGGINLSVDRNYLTLIGYNAAPGTVGVVGVASATENRVVAIVDGTSAINTTTALSDAFSAQNARGVVTTNGVDLWMAGSSGGVRYATKGATTSIVVAALVSNLRTISIYNSQLYTATASSTSFGVSSVGVGVPNTTGQTSTLLTGFPTASGPSSYAFELKSTGDVLYVADDRTYATGGGIQKWVLSGGTWSLAYTMNPVTSPSAGTVGARGLTVDWSGANPVIYATSSTTAIVKVTDLGSAATSTGVQLVAANTNTAFRGIAFAPSVPLPINLSSFDAQKTVNGNVLTWQANNAQNFGQFEIERKTDGRNFSPIATVQPNANGSYSFTDKQPLVSNYYRIKMVDKDGKTSYSKTVVIVNAAVGFAVSNVYPTIATSNITIEAFAANAAKVQVSVCNFSGQVLVNKNFDANQSFKETINISNLAAGTYVLKVQSGESQNVFKIVKQ